MSNNFFYAVKFFLISLVYLINPFASEKGELNKSFRPKSTPNFNKKTCSNALAKIVIESSSVNFDAFSRRVPLCFYSKQGDQKYD